MKNIASALVRAQKAFGPALKTNTNPHFKSKYADLAACIEAVIDGLNENGIALVQAMHECSDGVIVETIFVHESGEQLSAGKLHVPAAKQDPQGYGSALTYARRYSVMAACGIAPEDDDGNAASRKPEVGADMKHSPSKIAFERQPPDWQAYLTDLARDVENIFEQSGPQAARDLIDEATTRDSLDDSHQAALWFKVGSKARTAIDALTKGKK